jgi:hypothetical protein
MKLTHTSSKGIAYGLNGDYIHIQAPCTLNDILEIALEGFDKDTLCSKHLYLMAVPPEQDPHIAVMLITNTAYYREEQPQRVVAYSKEHVQLTGWTSYISALTACTNATGRTDSNSFLLRPSIMGDSLYIIRIPI